MQGEDVHWFVRGERLAGWLYLPLPSRAAAPCWVLCPGYAAVRYAAFYQRYVQRLTGAGYAVLLLDYRGWGDSEGPRGVIDPEMQVEDVTGAVTYLRARPEIDPDRIALLGFSFGGGVAIAAAARDRRVRLAASLFGVGDGRQWLRRQRREYEWQAFLAALEDDRRTWTLTGQGRMVQPSGDIAIPTPDRAEHGPTVFGDVPEGKIPVATPLWCAEKILAFRAAREVRRARGTAFLWFALDGDTVAPKEQSLAMYRQARPPRRLVLLEGTSHYRAFVDHLDTICGELFAWADRHISRRERLG
ncbi:MAG: alpha/beta fold hydrolase [Firmicutes bacterium]|nr:alpha/beta fold hydrolase [Bacillota bacterium]